MAYRNIRLHPVLRLIYLFLRILVWFGIKVFYRKRLVLGRENLRFDGPAIVIANHPSTLMDVLNPALEIRQEMFFLANYGLFKNPVSNWLLRRLYCIPVKRKEDVRDGEARSNDEAFKQSFQHLEKNGVLFIAPEGTSWMNRFVRELKTGTARIAFGAESRNNWRLDLKIIPVGLSYSAPDRFRSDVVVHVGPAVYPRDWEAQWFENRNQAVDDLTNYLANQLKTLSLHTRNEAGELLITRLEEVLQNEDPLPQKAAFERSQKLIRTALDDAPLAQRCADYFDNLKQSGLTDAAVVTSQKPGATSRALRDAAILLFGFPLFITGYIFWFLPCYLPWLLNKKMNIYIGYSSTVKILAGLITFPLALWGAYKLSFYLFQHTWPALLVTGMSIVLAYFVEQYQDAWQRFADFRAGTRAKNQLLPSLRKQRAALLALIPFA